MATTVRSWKLGEIASALTGELVGDPDILIERPVPAGTEDPRGITFAGDKRYLAKALEKPIGAVIVGPETGPLDVPTVVVADPKSAFGRVLALMARPLPIEAGVHPTAVVSPAAFVDSSASIGAYVVVEAGAMVGAGAKVYAQCYVGEGCSVGAGTILYPRVTLYQDVVLGERCILHSGVVVGADGFGFVWDGKTHQKIPQVGGVVIGNDVEIGANTCIDRATSGTTSIGRGSKFDNLIQVAHNVTVGEETVMAAQGGLAGSANVGSRVTMGGRVAVSDHMTVADDVVLGGRSTVFADLKSSGQYSGTPPVPITQAIRAMVLAQRLPELFQRLRALEAKALPDKDK